MQSAEYALPGMESKVFKCQICGHVAPSGTRATKVVLESRAKNYTSRGGGDGFQRRFRGPRPSRRDYDKGGSGHEIVREALACEACAKTITPAEPPVSATQHIEEPELFENPGEVSESE